MKQENAFSIAQIQLCAYSPDSEITRAFPKAGYFDTRHDFVATLTQSGLAVLVTVLNHRHENRGLRRWLSVSIVEENTGTVISSTVMRVVMDRWENTMSFRADLPFPYSLINQYSHYHVVVRDRSTGIKLGEQVLNMYDEVTIGMNASEWYSVKRAGVIPEWDDEVHRSLEVTNMAYHKVRFYLESHYEMGLHILPEVEIRLHFPNGEIGQRFVRPVSDDRWDGVVPVDFPFLATPANRGVCYAEVLMMDYVIGGFVFSTAGPALEGAWEDKGLECLETYTPEDAARRLRELSGHSSNEEEEKEGREAHRSAEEPGNEEDNDTFLSDDGFEEALNRLISPDGPLQTTEEEPDAATPDDDAQATGDETADATESSEATADISIEEALSSLTGLKTVKEKLKAYENLVFFNKMRIEKGLPSIPTPLHAMFLGSPGTGKTTVAKKMGEMLRRAGMLSKGHVVVKERSSLIGKYYSTEETNTLEAIEEAQGGILFIDEAYQLYQPEDPRDPGKFVIETLLTALADENRRDWMLILCGYRDRMLSMFEMNPGLKSRIPESNIYTFDDFSETELLEIADTYFRNNRFTLSEEARSALGARLGRDCSMKTENFGNARHVLNLIQTGIIPSMAMRVASSGAREAEDLTIIQACDIPGALTSLREERRTMGFRV